MDLLVENFPLQGMNFICTSQFPTCVTSLCTLSTSSVTYQQASIWFVPEPHSLEEDRLWYHFVMSKQLFRLMSSIVTSFALLRTFFFNNPWAGFPGRVKELAATSYNFGVGRWGVQVEEGIAEDGVEVGNWVADGGGWLGGSGRHVCEQPGILAEKLPCYLWFWVCSTQTSSYSL